MDLADVWKNTLHFYTQYNLSSLLTVHPFCIEKVESTLSRQVACHWRFDLISINTNRSLNSSLTKQGPIIICGRFGRFDCIVMKKLELHLLASHSLQWFFLLVVSTCARELKVPITAKIRIFEDMDKTIHYAQMLERAGAQVSEAVKYALLSDWRRHKALTLFWEVESDQDMVTCTKH